MRRIRLIPALIYAALAVGPAGFGPHDKPATDYAVVYKITLASNP
jgi:hypothetical protein